MPSIAFYCDRARIERNALEQLENYAQKPYVSAVCAFTDIHYCSEKALPVGVAFRTRDYFYPLITGKDIGCGVMYLQVSKEYWLKPFNKAAHYAALQRAHHRMTDDGLGGGNHFLSIEEDAEAVYILCHTGTRDRGIAMYQECLQLTRDFSGAFGREVDFVHRDFIQDDFFRRYEEILRFGYDRRKQFCLKTLSFLQVAGYIKADKKSIEKNYLLASVKNAPEEGTWNGTPFRLEDSVHNHLRFVDGEIIHRKGSTELGEGKTVVIPLSMSRGSLLVQARQGMKNEALFSCAHGAGRRLSRYDAMKHWKTVLKEKERVAYRRRFSELLDHSGDFPRGYVQEFDFAYKSAEDIFLHQPYLRKITQTVPVVTVKYSEI